MDFLKLPEELYIDLYYDDNGTKSSQSLYTYVTTSESQLLIITGSSGSGKSTLAKKLANNYIDLSCHNGGNIELAGEGKSIVFDAFDELSEEDAKKLIKCIHTTDCKVILLSKPEAVINHKLEFKSPKILEILPFEKNDLEKYVRNFVSLANEGKISLLEVNEFYKTHDANTVLSYIYNHQDIQSLVKNPFMLALMMISFSKVESLNESNEISTARVKIFQGFTNFWFSYHSKKSNDQETLKNFMNVYCQNVAQYFFNKGRVEMGFIDLSPEKELLLLQPEDNAMLKQSYSTLSEEDKLNLLTNVKKGALLNRSSNGTIRFYHRALLEYFFSVHLFRDVFEVVNKGLPSKSEISLVSHRIREPEIVVHLTERVNVDKDFQSILQRAVLLTRDVPGFDILGSNAITILNKGGKFIFSGMDLRYIQVPFADLSASFCGNTDFRGANLHGVNFCNAWLSCAKFDGALLSMVDFGGTRRMWVEKGTRVINVKYLQTLDSRSFVVAFCQNLENNCFIVAYDFRDLTREFYRYVMDSSDKCKAVELIKGNETIKDMISLSSVNKIIIWDFLEKVIVRIIEFDEQHKVVSVMPCLSYAYSIDGGVLKSYLMQDNIGPTPVHEYINEHDKMLRSKISNVYSVIEFVEHYIFFFVAGIGALYILNKELKEKRKIHDEFGNYSCMAAFPKRKLVALGGALAGVVIRNYETGDKIATVHRGGILCGQTSCIAFSTNGKYLASVSETEGRWLVYDTKEWTLVASFAEEIRSIDFFPSTSESSVILTNGGNDIQVIFAFDSDLSKKKFESMNITHLTFSEQKMYLLSQLGNHDFRVRVCDKSSSEASNTFDVVLGDPSRGPNEMGAEIKFFSPFLRFDCLLFFLYKMQNSKKYRLAFCSVLPIPMILNTLYCSESNWELHDSSKFAVKGNYLAYSTETEIRLLFGDIGDCSDTRFELPYFVNDPFETFPARKVKKLFFEGDKLLYYSGDDKKIHVISTSNWQEEKNLFLPMIPVDFFMLNDKLYHINEEGELYCEQSERMLCHLGFRTEHRKMLDNTVVFVGRLLIEHAAMYLAFFNSIKMEITKKIEIPLWFVPYELKFYPNELKVVALHKKYHSHVAVVSFDDDEFNNNWKLEQVMSYSAYLDMTNAIFKYVYQLGSIVNNATRAAEVDEYTSRASLLTPLIHIPTNNQTEPIIRANNKIISVNENQWIISAVQQKVTHNLLIGDHVFLLLEGVFKTKRFVSKMHLVRDKKSVFVKAYPFSIDKLAELKEIQSKLNAQQWPISADKGITLIESVLTDKQEQLDFNVFSKNCAKWAIKKVKGIGIIIDKKWYNFLIVLPSDVYGN